MNQPISPLRQNVKDFKNHLESLGRASATILAYTKDVDQLIDFIDSIGKTTPQTIVQEDIENFKNSLNDKKFTAKSISRKINSIKAFFRFLKGQGIIDANPTTLVSHPKYDIKPPRILSKLEYRALRDTCKNDTRISAIVEILLQTGMRISEAANLNVADLELDNNKIKINPYESHDARTVPINDATKSTLEKYLSERPKTNSPKLFITKTGNPFLVRNIRSSIDRYFRLSGIEGARVNDLRHTFIAHQLMAGAPLVYISKLAGHKRLSTTEKYLEFINGKANQERPKLEEL
jgi:integrase/recombinase XerD